MHLFAHEAPTVRTLRNAGLRAVQAAGPLKRLLTTRALRS
jgi:2-polyprenyl-6-methoxyphenol hydroxylase-like FAD-dependent oxidoreductase